MSLKQGMPYYKPISPLLRGFGKYPPTCDGKLIQYTNYKKTQDEYLIDQLRGTNGGVVDGRVNQRGWYFEGDGTRFWRILTDVFYDGENLIYERKFKFKGDLSFNTFINCGNRINGGFIVDLSNDIRVFGYLDGSKVKLISEPFAFVVDEVYTIRVELINLNIEIFVNGVSIRTGSFSSTRDTSTEFRFMARATGNNVSNDEVYYEMITDSNWKTYRFDFEEGNIDNVVIGTTDGIIPPIRGTILNATGSDRVQTDNVEGRADLVGYLEADGVNHYYDANLTELIPVGTIIPASGNKASAYIDDGQGGSQLADLSFSKELRGDIIKCDIDGTPNVNGLYVKQATTKYKLTQADKTLTNRWYDDTDPDNIVALVKEIPATSRVDNFQEFISIPWVQTFYSEAIQEPCLTKVFKFEKMVEGLFDENGEALFDIDGDRLYALLEGVEIV